MKRCRRARPLGQYRIVAGRPHDSEAPRRVDRSARMHQGGRAHPEIQSRLAGSERGAAQLVHAESIFRRGTPPDAEYTFRHALCTKRVACIMLSLDAQHRQFPNITLSLLITRQWSDRGPFGNGRHFASDDRWVASESCARGSGGLIGGRRHRASHHRHGVGHRIFPGGRLEVSAARGRARGKLCRFRSWCLGL
jgi:hypothetical protein